jgi:hypothetical protein
VRVAQAGSRVTAQHQREQPCDLGREPRDLVGDLPQALVRQLVTGQALGGGRERPRGLLELQAVIGQRPLPVSPAIRPRMPFTSAAASGWQ